MSTFIELIELKSMLSLHVSLSLRTGVFSTLMAKGDEVVLLACHNQRAGSGKRICISHQEETELVFQERPSSCQRLGG